MPRKKAGSPDLDWGFKGPRGDRTPEAFAALASATKLRTLWDMSEREIRALERLYGCPVIRPDRAERPRRARRASGGGVPVAAGA